MTLPAASAATVPSDDRGYLYGDGLFETLACYRGRLLWEDLHMERLRLGAQRLSLAAPLRDIIDDLRAAAAGLTAPFGVLRLTLTRGSGPRGYAPPYDSHSRWHIDGSALDADPLSPEPPLHAAFAEVRLSAQPALAGIKHLNRLEQVLAAQQARRDAVDDVLMLTPEGKLHSSSRANLFVFCGEILLTAPCDQQGIAGTRRRLILETLAPSLGIPVRETFLDAGELAAASGAFVCNSVMGIREIGRVAGQPLARDRRSAELQSAYRSLGLACAG